MCHVTEKAMGIKLPSADCKNADDKGNYLEGYVEYNGTFQRELAYIIESIEPFESLMIPGPTEDGTCYVFPGFAWTILMRRYVFVYMAKHEI